MIIQKLKYAIKLCLAYSLYFSGILSILSRIKLKDKTVVLMYHRVLSADERCKSLSNGGIITETETFERHMAFLKKTFHVIGMNDFVSNISAHKKQVSNSCLITFDDGWVDNYNNAFPILKKNNIKATIFLPINYIGKENNFWQEKLGHILTFLVQNKNKYSTKFRDIPEITNIVNSPDSMQKKLIMALIFKTKKSGHKNIQLMINNLLTLIPTDEHENISNKIDHYISWDNANEMLESNVSFGSHAASHFVLTDLSKEQVNRELTDSRQLIKSRLNCDILSVAYPNGNYSSDICAIAKSAGYIAGFTTKRGFFSSDCDPLRIPRMNIHDNATRNIPMFYCRILGIL